MASCRHWADDWTEQPSMDARMERSMERRVEMRRELSQLQQERMLCGAWLADAACVADDCVHHHCWHVAFPLSPVGEGGTVQEEGVG